MNSTLTRVTNAVVARLMSTVVNPLIKAPTISLTSREVADAVPVSVPTRHGDVRCYITRAATGAPLATGAAGPPVHIHIHGGAFLSGVPRQNDNLVRSIAGEVGATVVNVEYTKAPVARYPRAHEECYDVLRWVQRFGDVMGWDGARVSISGVSAGGNLALGALEQARLGGDPALRAGVLIVPAVDQTIPPEQYTSPLPPSAAEAHPPFVSPRLVRLSQENYFADATRRAEPLASPVLNDAGIAALPPLLVVTAERDSIRAQDERFIDLARAKGVSVTDHCMSGVDHGFPESSKKEDEAAVREMAELVRVHLTAHLA
ncbi:MAG TPA: alpha/beta hydrolase [Blastococcus sp.]|nr:alpha/beta hydrolase [Blastococcus sp.]